MSSFKNTGYIVALIVLATIAVINGRSVEFSIYISAAYIVAAIDGLKK